MEKQNIVNKINKTLKEFFSMPSNPKKVKAKSLMNLFIEKGIFSSNHSNGLPIRDYLRYLDDNNMLHLIPYVMVERKAIYRNWFFVDISSCKTSSSVNDKYETRIKKKSSQSIGRRTDSDEFYIIDLCDKILNQKASRQHKFDFLIGDTGRKLPVDAYYERLNLVVEYYEYQHDSSVPFFDKKMTVSGVSRDIQRRIYDQRRLDVLPKHGINIVVLRYTDFGSTKKLKRDVESDFKVINDKLRKFVK
ncbi:hypothetical protein H6B13_06380 [Bacteroides gallinaceum]|uniref:hypothetical protein n=1 Tax=Bacteroides gallinaceum TaxID=1462571 RepID=UPI00195C6885|nr:hypothetical protein [Bacteroides gallinaceum]MBM6719274.1 hypothetical protein [Bacteroides gallinaceum]